MGRDGAGIPVGFCGVQGLVRREKQEEAQFVAIEETIRASVEKYRSLFHEMPNVCFVRMAVPGVRRRLAAMDLGGVAVVPVDKQMLMWHVWVGVRQDERLKGVSDG